MVRKTNTTGFLTKASASETWSEVLESVKVTKVIQVRITVVSPLDTALNVKNRVSST